MRPAPTLLVLAAAAAFGGFAATAIRDALHAPASATEPAAASALPAPAVAALPAAVDGQPMPSLAPMLKRVTPSVVAAMASRCYLVCVTCSQSRPCSLLYIMLVMRE